MNKLKTILLATVITPPMALAPTFDAMAQRVQLAQAPQEKKEPEHREPGRAPPPGAPPHAAPQAAPPAAPPRAAPPAPHAEPPRAAPPAPHAEPPRGAPPAPTQNRPGLRRRRHGPSLLMQPRLHRAQNPALPRLLRRRLPRPRLRPRCRAASRTGTGTGASPSGITPARTAGSGTSAPRRAGGTAASGSSPAAPGAPPPPAAAPPQRPGAPPAPPPGAPPAPGPTGQGPRPPAPNAPPQQQGRGGIGPAGAAAIGAAAGFVGGFMASQGVQRFDQVREQRREVTRDGSTVILEPGRTIVRERDQTFVVHDENERFRMLGGDVQTQQRSNETTTIYRRPDGDEVVTITDPNGQLLRRFRRGRDGREIVIIDNTFRGPPRSFEEDVVVLPPPPIDLPRDRYIVDAGAVDERVVYDTLVAPPLAPLPRRYTLNEVRYSPDLRAYTRAIDLDTINFDSGSWSIGANQQATLATIAQAMNQAIGRNPREVFLIEGHTDAVGAAVDNLSLSDRRAQSVAALLTSAFNVPPENLTTQGYGAQYLKVQTQEASRENRRVTVRRITPLLDGQR